MKARFPAALEWIQRRLGISWYELERQLGSSHAHLWEYRQGKRFPPPQELLSLMRLAQERDVIAEFLDLIQQGSPGTGSGRVGSSSNFDQQRRGGAAIAAARARVTGHH